MPVPATKIKIPKKFRPERDPKCYFPRRYIITLLSFFGMFNVYAMRVNLSVAMVAMINSTVDASENTTRYTAECPLLIHEDTQDENEGFKGEQYHWDSKTQGMILGAFFYGYVITQIPGGMMSEKVGAKWIYGGGVLITAIFSLLTPLAASWGIGTFVTVRVLEGLGEGVTFPSMNTIISNWAPKLERSRISTFIHTGAQMGNVISMPVSGWLSSSDLLGGWPSVFYVFGTLGCLWFLLWSILVYETPKNHPSISSRELQHIQKNKDDKPQKNGLLSALPYIVEAISAWIFSFCADRLRHSGKLSITTIRKIFNSIGLFGPAACLLGVTVSGCNPELIIGLFTLAMALNGGIYSGFNVTHVDMNPDLAGTTFGITNAISNLSGIIGPAVVGYFTASGATRANWSSVFYITAGVYTVCGAFFAMFASAELQPWIKQTENDTKHTKPEKSFYSIETKS
ncbi:sialin-like isoform X3 [Stegodyphus dumicola]|uniref:sialin-like isoform X3 n=1 Tax=Stegodyphus dumicola TaxID=202533 RepID=UPI0015AC534B|nr:sialin-like isoform X3 [Stegodyphus dumicola]